MMAGISSGAILLPGVLEQVAKKYAKQINQVNDGIQALFKNEKAYQNFLRDIFDIKNTDLAQQLAKTTHLREVLWDEQLLNKIKQFADRAALLKVITQSQGFSKALLKNKTWVDLWKYFRDHPLIIRKNSVAEFSLEGIQDIGQITLRQNDGITDIFVHHQEGKYWVYLEKEGKFSKSPTAMGEGELAVYLQSRLIDNQDPIRLLSCSDLASAQKLSKHLEGRNIYATDDIVAVHTDGGITTVARSGNDTQKWRKLKNGEDIGEAPKPKEPQNVEAKDNFTVMGLAYLYYLGVFKSLNAHMDAINFLKKQDVSILKVLSGSPVEMLNVVEKYIRRDPEVFKQVFHKKITLDELNIKFNEVLGVSKNWEEAMEKIKQINYDPITGGQIGNRNCSSCVDKVLDVLYDKDVPSLQALTNELAEARGNQYEDIIKRYKSQDNFKVEYREISVGQLNYAIKEGFQPGETALVCINYSEGRGSHIFNALNDGKQALFLDGQDITGIFQHEEKIVNNLVYLIVLKEKIADKFIFTWKKP